MIKTLARRILDSIAPMVSADHPYVTGDSTGPVNGLLAVYEQLATMQQLATRQSTYHKQSGSRAARIIKRSSTSAYKPGAQYR